MEETELESTAAVTPTQMLVAAVLRQAILDGDVEWIEADHHEPWGFVWICDNLLWDVATVREMSLKAVTDHKLRNYKRRSGGNEEDFHGF